MASSLKSLSQIWNKNNQQSDDEYKMADIPSSRRQLSRQFQNVDEPTQNKRMLRSRSVLSSISNLNVSNVPKETRKLLQAGADKINQTLSDWSQVISFDCLLL